MSFGLSAAAWGAIAVGMSAVTAGVTAYGASQQADAQKKAANYQAQVEANNAKIAAWQRSDAIQRGEQDAQRSMRERSAMIGKQRAALAANGVDLNQGSALDLLASTEFLGQEEVNTIQSNAAREAWGYQIQGANYSNNSSFEQWKARNASPGKAGAMAGASSLLSSASSYAMSKAAK
jgi:hypothetical protein